MSRRDEYNPVAIEIPFDNTSSDFDSEDVQSVIEEIGLSASPGFNFGRASNVNAGTWLQVVGGVPSNKAGITVALISPEIRQVYVSSETVGTFDVGIYEHEGDEINLTLLGTVSITSARSGTFNVGFSVTSGRQLAVKLTSGSARNVSVGLQLSGSTT